MNRILYEQRCKCKEEFAIIKKRKKKRLSKGKPLPYPELSEIESGEILSKTFQMKYQTNLSLTAKCILNNFHNKYIYYAIDDILYSLQSQPIERDNLLAVLYSPILSLQNNFSVNFFDIWIREVYIDEISKNNKFLKNNSTKLKEFNFITIKFFYQTRLPVKKQESLW
jgi:hypothetical protein